MNVISQQVRQPVLVISAIRVRHADNHFGSLFR